ncbi:MAG: DUF3833 domain-containing protein [Oleiphilaceae bacterium]|nr:DUF3833 domain-containing protein [Oleiphilaceae bacterium]
MQKQPDATSWNGWRSILAIGFMSALLSGCAGPALEDYSNLEPELEPTRFFEGELVARGVVKDWSGEVIRTFDADITASWDEDGVGTLDEVFRFNDGERQTRVWTLTPDGEGYRATAGDVVEAGQMRWSGNAIHMNYVLRVEYGDDDSTLDVRMDDWMHLVTEDTLINQTTMSKWGFNVGELVLVIRKLEPMNE